MHRVFAVLPIVIGLCGVSAAAQVTHTVPPTRANVPAMNAPLAVSVTLAPFTMTGLRGATVAVQPVAIDLAPFAMTGLRGATVAFTPLQMDLNPFVMTGLRGATAPPPAVQLTLQPFQMTGMR